MKAVLVIGCDGRVDDGFQFCSGVRNVLLDFEHQAHTANYRTLVEYLDISSKLFEGPCFNTNIISNTLYKLYELGYLTERIYGLTIQLFQWHKRCGLWIKIEPKEN